MKAQDLPAVSGKYNLTWCERRPLVCADEERVRRAGAFGARRDLAPSARDAFFLHELTGCQGLEFVAISNARLASTARLSEGVVLIPCFLSDMDGAQLTDPIVQETLRMERQSRFIYDGWMPISTWAEKDVEKAVRHVDEALSLFCLVGRSAFQWEAKYHALDEPMSAYIIEESHLRQLEEVARIIDSLDEDDRIAIFRSIAWLSQGLRLHEPAARFLFSILAIEALATHIESVSDQSPLFTLRADRKTKFERDDCIRETLAEWVDENPARAVQEAYTNCVVGIGQRLKQHLAHVLGTSSETVMLLFEDTADGKSMYDLRHDIAHGSTDALSEGQRERIRQRVWDAERAARKYISEILSRALGAQVSAGGKADLSMDLRNAIVSNEGMYRGPTHMAVLYSSR